MAGLLAFAAPASSDTVETPACKRELAETWAGMEAALARLKKVARAGSAERCGAYLEHAAIVTKARDVLDRCKIGREREGDLAHMDGALDDVKATISRECTNR
jgi:hypothetical protein